MSVPGGEVQRQIAGRYRVDGPLGSGAMGTVWSGFDDVLQRRVAIKELKFPEGIPAGEELELRERMMREARALAGLSHPNVVTVFDVLDAEGDPLVVMELVPSRNLATAITELGRLDRSQAAVVGYGTSAALRAAHRAGITHRDVKPGNVLISDDGRIKLTDFGIARNESDAPMTSAGLVLGSPAYIAPEVAAGQPVTPAADLWGLGATLFAAVEGRPPYDVDGDPVRTLTEVVDGTVPRVSDPGPLGDVIAGLMVKEPAGRMPLDEVRVRLSPLLADPSDPIFPGSPDVPTVTGMVPPNVAPPSAASGPSRGRATRSLLRGRAVPESPARPDASGPNRVASSQPGQAAAPLSSDPGPLPGGFPAPADQGPRATGHYPAPPPPVRPQPAPQAVRPAPAAPRKRMGVLTAIPLVIGGALIILLGAVGGYAAVRTVAGQEAFSTVTATTDRAHRVPRPDPLGFTVSVPEAWSQFRWDGGRAPTVVRYVSPDGSEELAVRSAASAREVTDNLNPQALGVDTATTAGYGTPPSGTEQMVVRTADGPQRRTMWLRIVPARDGSVWAVSLTVPGSRSESISSNLFEGLADDFRATG
ncbi:serine/threonine-protein kinase [Pseudonocardia endophytica]|uniref:serine/threonine-protein kinase n=1 Tax=Pseudonocardia endophytica TaxID=401976 RepID=UPI001FB40488|nr:serine/threonine-protein kinase [Pseudonocardia endophytica]